MEAKENNKNRTELLEKAFCQAVANTELDFIFADEKDYKAIKQDVKYMVLKRSGNYHDGGRTI